MLVFACLQELWCFVFTVQREANGAREGAVVWPNILVE